jgi:hypothetical protein
MKIAGTEPYDTNSTTSPTSSGKDRGCLQNAAKTYTYYQVIYAQ